MGNSGRKSRNEPGWIRQGKGFCSGAVYRRHQGIEVAGGNPAQVQYENGVGLGLLQDCPMRLQPLWNPEPLRRLLQGLGVCVDQCCDDSFGKDYEHGQVLLSDVSGADHGDLEDSLLRHVTRSLLR